MVHRLCAHLLDGSVELRNQIVGFVGGSASRAFDLDQHPDVDEVVKIAFAEQKAPSKAAGQKFRGRRSRTNEPSPARASRTPSTTRLFTASGLSSARLEIGSPAPSRRE